MSLYFARFIRLPVALPDDPYTHYWTWRGQFDARAALEAAGLSLDKLKGWHECFSGDATDLDPAEQWHLVIRHAKFSRRDELKGDLRLAYDFYEMAELLRLLHHDASGHWLPAEDGKLESSMHPQKHQNTSCGSRGNRHSLMPL